MFKFYPILKTNKKTQKTLPLSLPPQSFRYCLLFAFWHCQIYWKNHGLFFLSSHSLPKCNLTSDPASLLTLLQIKKSVIFNLEAVLIPLNIYFVHIKTLPWCSLLPHLLLSLLTSLVCSFQTIWLHRYWYSPNIVFSGTCSVCFGRILGNLVYAHDFNYQLYSW